MDINKIINYIQIDLGLTQSELADEIGVHVNTVRNILKGNDPSLHFMKSLMNLDITEERRNQLQNFWIGILKEKN